jgi:hypothetical protein
MENPVQFVSDRITAAAVSKDGSMALIQFNGGDQRLWLTVTTVSRIWAACANDLRRWRAMPKAASPRNGIVLDRNE